MTPCKSLPMRACPKAKRCLRQPPFSNPRDSTAARQIPGQMIYNNLVDSSDNIFECFLQCSFAFPLGDIRINMEQGAQLSIVFAQDAPDDHPHW
jgi:hypothetical protein